MAVATGKSVPKSEILQNSGNYCSKSTTDIIAAHKAVIYRSIDCDMHGEDHTPSYFMQICKYFREDLRDYLRACAPDIPLPNTIVYSGRGLQFWWSFLPILKDYEDCYDFLLDVFINIFKKFLQDNPQYSQFEVDEGASRNKAGLFRMPGTYNTHSDTKTSVYIIHDEVSDMFAMRKELTPKRHTPKVRTSFFGSGSVDFNGNGFEKYASFRASAILQLLSLRKFDVNGSIASSIVMVAVPLSKSGVYVNATSLPPEVT